MTSACLTMSCPGPCRLVPRRGGAARRSEERPRGRRRGRRRAQQPAASSSSLMAHHHATADPTLFGPTALSVPPVTLYTAVAVLGSRLTAHLRPCPSRCGVRRRGTHGHAREAGYDRSERRKAVRWGHACGAGFGARHRDRDPGSRRLDSGSAAACFPRWAGVPEGCARALLCCPWPAAPLQYANGTAKWLTSKGATLIFNERVDTQGCARAPPSAPRPPRPARPAPPARCVAPGYNECFLGSCRRTYNDRCCPETCCCAGPAGRPRAPPTPPRAASPSRRTTCSWPWAPRPARASTTLQSWTPHGASRSTRA